MSEIVVAKHRSVGLPDEPTYERMWKVASGIARTEMVPGDLKGKPESVFATMLAGREIGLGPLESLRSFYVVDGKPTESAELLHTLALRAGHDVYVQESTRDRCVVMARHRDWPEDRPPREFVWDVEDAASAELVSYVCADVWPRHQTEQVTKNGQRGTYTRTECVADDRGVRCKDNWRKYGRSMLRSRCITEAVRAICPEVTVGATYTAEELGAEVHGPSGAPVGRDEDAWSRPLDDVEDEVAQVVAEQHDHDDEVDETGEPIADAVVVDETLPCQATPPGRDFPMCELPEGHDGDHEAGRARWKPEVAPAPDPEPEAEADVVDVCDVCGAPEDGHTHDASQEGADGDGPSPDTQDAQPQGEAERPEAGEDADDGPSSPASNPCPTCGPEPRTQPCPDCPSDEPELPWQRADRLGISAADQMLKIRELAGPLKATVPARRQYAVEGRCHPGLLEAYEAYLDEVEEGLSQPVGAR